MKKILVISGSRADAGLLEWPVKVLRESFEVDFEKLWGLDFGKMHDLVATIFSSARPDCLLLLGDRFEILAAAIAAHLARVPIAHIGGGDVTEGSYDDAMRDCISRLAEYHFTTSLAAQARVWKMGHALTDVYMIGNIAIDYIRHGEWKGGRPHAEPYVVVSYQAETFDGVAELKQALQYVGDRFIFVIRPNADAGSDMINRDIDFLKDSDDAQILENLPHAEFLNLIYHCEEFIGNSSAMLYEAPELGVKCRMIGKRQQGRVIPTGDGKASERIREVLCQCL